MKHFLQFMICIFCISFSGIAQNISDEKMSSPKDHSSRSHMQKKLPDKFSEPRFPDTHYDIGEGGQRGKHDGPNRMQRDRNSFSKTSTGIDTAWVRHYASGLTPEYETARAVFVDAPGNVYVTGFCVGSSSTRDYATIKYNSNGDTLWVRKYNGPGNNEDVANSIAVDDSGNVYVTGLSDDVGTFSVFATIKYNSNGDTLWVRRYNGPGNGSNDASALAVDGSGNVHVTGYSYGSGTSKDYATVKYNSNGDTLWVRRYNGPGNSDDDATSFAVDGSGNVYVTGSSYGSGTSYYDYATIKYNSNGDTLWVRRYSGPENGLDNASSLAVDGSGNVYVTGLSYGVGTSSDYATIKYNSNGDTLWVRRYNGPGNSYDKATSLAVDGSGNVYVTGLSDGLDTSSVFATIKYNSNGDTLWVRKYNGPESGGNGASFLAVDSSGNVYITCNSDGIVTVKYSSTGNEEWASHYGTDYPRFPYGIRVDKTGNVYVGGNTMISRSTSFYTTIKYVQTPTAVEERSTSVPSNFSLEQNYPNPFNPTTTISYQLPISSKVTLRIYDLLGREVATLVNQEESAGWKEVEWDASSIASGIYFYKLQANNFIETKKMLIIK